MRHIAPLAGRLWIVAPAEPPEWLHLGERVFRLARWRKAYPGVVIQYREHVPVRSMHLMVYADGTYSIDHVDDFNPDLGFPVRHLVFDLLGLGTESAAR